MGPTLKRYWRRLRIYQRETYHKFMDWFTLRLLRACQRLEKGLLAYRLRSKMDIGDSQRHESRGLYESRSALDDMRR